MYYEIISLESNTIVQIENIFNNYFTYKELLLYLIYIILVKYFFLLSVYIILVKYFINI